MTFFRPWPGLISSRALTSPKDSRRVTSRFTAFRSRRSLVASSETGAGFSRTARITRTRSAESTRTKSAGSSKVMVISDGSLSPRSIFRARSSDRPMNASTDPDETVIRGDLFLVGFATFFIFVPPEIADLIIEPPCQRLVSSEHERFLLTHEVPMMVVMAVVVPEYPPVVRSANRGVDLREAVLDDLPVLVLPDYFLEHSPRRGRFK